MTACVDCGSEIKDFRHAWQKVEGWSRPRKGGGTNALALRRPVQEFMCETCMLRQKMGMPKQESLL